MAYLIMIFSVLSRLIPHAWNFSPVYGALLFGGARMKKRDSVWFPLVFLAASDFVLTNLLYHLRVGWQEMIQLASFAAIAMIGWTLRSRVTIPRFTVACLAAPLSFYLISNFGVPHLPANLERIDGLLRCWHSLPGPRNGEHRAVRRIFLWSGASL